jgi:hypothetical protein
MPKPRLVLVSALLLNGLVACGDDDGAGGPDAALPPDGGADAAAPADARVDAGPGADAEVPADAGPTLPLVGAIHVIESRALGQNAYAAAEVRALISPDAASSWHTEVAAQGDCRRLEYVPAFCDPSCDTGFCVGDPGVCVPYPTSVNAGTITITGLTGGLATMTYDTYGYYLVPAPPPDCFAEGALIVASLAGGGGYPALDVEAAGVETLETATITGWQVTVPAADDAEFVWTPSGQAGDRVRLTLRSENEAHGMPVLGIIECDAPDAPGALTVPGSLLADFPATSGPEICVLHDCPPSSLARYARSATPAPGGEVELRIESLIQFGLVHPAP